MSDNDQWSYTEEPHAGRRKTILAAHPEIHDLMKPDRRAGIQIYLMSICQILIASQAHKFSWPVYIFVLYFIGGTLNHSLSLGLHEMSHHTVFGILHKRLHLLTVLVCNLPLGIPAYFTFRKYHLDHHRYMGDCILDTDIPTKFETILYRTTLGKLAFIILQPLSYSLRPLLVRPKKPTHWEVYNFLIQIAFNVLVAFLLGPSALIYLLASTFVGLSLHPISGHFISEHYVFVNGYETYSYYGPLNWLTFNVGYHNEHHDFPSVPGYKLPQVNKIANEFYANLPCHRSWIKVLYDFITSPAMTLESRVKRKSVLLQDKSKKTE